MAGSTERVKRVEVSRYEALTRAALAEVTSEQNVGDWVEDRVREAVVAAEGETAVDDAPGAAIVDVVYTSAQPGYRGWSWVVSVAEVDGEAPTVLELGLIPGEDALLAPEWIPWSVRLAEWQAQQAAAAAEAGEPDDAEEPDDDGDEQDDSEDSDEDDSDEDDDLDDEDDDDPDEDGPRATHGGDIDGVDIDDLVDDED